jgi:hypothetical protein
MPLSQEKLKQDLLDIVFNSGFSSTSTAAEAWLTVLSNYISNMSVPPSSTIAITSKAAAAATLSGLATSFAVIPSLPPVTFATIDTIFMPFLLTDVNSIALTNTLTPPVGFGTYAFAGIVTGDDNETIASKMSSNIHKTITSSVWINATTGVTGTWA